MLLSEHRNTTLRSLILELFYCEAIAAAEDFGLCSLSVASKYACTTISSDTGIALRLYGRRQNSDNLTPIGVGGEISVLPPYWHLVYNLLSMELFIVW